MSSSAEIEIGPPDPHDLHLSDGLPQSSIEMEDALQIGEAVSTCTSVPSFQPTKSTNQLSKCRRLESSMWSFQTEFDPGGLWEVHHDSAIPLQAQVLP